MVRKKDKQKTTWSRSIKASYTVFNFCWLHGLENIGKSALLFDMTQWFS